jgi:hypothetical protein
VANDNRELEEMLEASDAELKEAKLQNQSLSNRIATLQEAY